MLRASSPEMSLVGATIFEEGGNRRTVRWRPLKTLGFVMEILQIFSLVGTSDDELARLSIRNGVFITMFVEEVAPS
jgi:hypothetical protein